MIASATVNNTPYLSPDELFELTGHRQRPAQIAWLREKHWRHVVDADGKPKVTREYWHRKMIEDADMPELEIVAPNFDALRPKPRAA